MEIEQLLSFALASLMMALMPGPDVLYVLTESLHKGKKAGIWLAFGLNSGVIVHTLLAITGVSILIKQSDLAFDILKYGGAIYLTYLLYKTIKEKPSETNLDSKEPQSYSPLKQFKTGVFMNVLNPKVSLFFLAFLPQFIDTESALSFSSQLSLLGLIFMGIGFLTFATVAILADGFRSMFESPKFFTITKAFKILVLGMIIVYIIAN